MICSSVRSCLPELAELPACCRKRRRPKTNCGGPGLQANGSHPVAPQRLQAWRMPGLLSWLWSRERLFVVVALISWLITGLALAFL
ncbi:MAG: hypothetical protein ACRBC3_09690 [Burkholderiaceae bacterium]